MRILEELWCGQIQPAEMVNFREKEYQELEILASHNEGILLQDLSSDQKEMFCKTKDLWEEMNQISTCGGFIAGFRLAVQLLTASMG